MTSDEIARKFYDQGLANKWLSKKQAAWLYNQACDEAKRHLTHHGTPTAGGLFTLDNGTSIGLDIAISPVNGCAVFQTRNVSEIAAKQEAERVEMIEQGKQFAQMVKDSPMADLYDAVHIARIYKVSVEMAQGWLNG